MATGRSRRPPQRPRRRGLHGMAIPETGRPENGLRMCPTRIDKAAVLFAHKVTHPQCQKRQREHYHKCFACVWNNAYAAAKDAVPVAAAGPRRPTMRAG